MSNIVTIPLTFHSNSVQVIETLTGQKGNEAFELFALNCLEASLNPQEILDSVSSLNVEDSLMFLSKLPYKAIYK